MKRLIPISILTIFILFLSPLSNGTAARSTETALNVDPNIAPGSIVQFEHLTIEDGLSQNAGLAIFQDSKGYLWIGSQDGLNRYDGFAFKIYKHDPEDPSSISHNSILAITEDKDGYLWMGTWGGGLDRFDPVTETFGSYRSDPPEPASLSSDAISVIFEDSNHRLWIGTGPNGVEGSGLNRLDPATRKAFRYQHDKSASQSLASNNIASIYESSDGTFWIATGGFSLHGAGLDQFDPHTGTARHFSNNPKVPDSLSANDLMTLWGDSSGMLWIGTWSNGLNLMNLSNPGHFLHYQNDPFFSESLSGNEVWSIYKDRSGILWIGTSHSGINKLPSNSGQFSLYRSNPSDPASLSTNATGAFSEDKHGNIWIATWGAGLERFDPDAGQFEHFRYEPNNPDSLSDDLFMAVYVDPYDTVWAGTLGKGMNRLSPTISRVLHYLHNPEDPNSLADDNVASIIPDKKGGLWIGTFGGLSHYDPHTNIFTNYSNDPENSSSLHENKIVNLYLDSTQNVLLIGTWGGGQTQLDLNDPLSTDPKLATFINYRNNPDDPSSLSEDSV